MFQIGFLIWHETVCARRQTFFLDNFGPLLLSLLLSDCFCKTKVILVLLLLFKDNVFSGCVVVKLPFRIDAGIFLLIVKLGLLNIAIFTHQILVCLHSLVFDDVFISTVATVRVCLFIFATSLVTYILQLLIICLLLLLATI